MSKRRQDTITKEQAINRFNEYYDKSVLFGGTDLGVGVGDRSDYNNYVRLKSSNKIDLKYKVKEKLHEFDKDGGFLF